MLDSVAHAVNNGITPHRVIFTVDNNQIRAFDYKEAVNPAKGGEREWAFARTYGFALIHKPADLNLLKNVDTDARAKFLAKSTDEEVSAASHQNMLNILMTGITLLPLGGEVEAISRGDYVDAAISGFWRNWSFTTRRSMAVG